ncbi:MAG TPA: tRNA pseudouridine(38-40) synthase TruA [Steroidobacteraceae bacterium]|nr:tRNA pseudouridine(38-40) synthase TruA [Steroidobacteraceae bacterium]
MRRRFAVGIEYEGSAYCGWQIQSAAASVQGALQAALSRVADEPIGLICAGRTDAGVHARAQVAHFDTDAVRATHAWLLGANTYLPADISLRWVRAVADHFHARYSARSRTYRYLILNRCARSALAAGRALLVHRALDVAAMQQGARWLLGEHDFSAFRSSECQARSPVRELRTVQLERSGDWVSIDLTANAFLHHMVRNIVGLLIAIGLGYEPPERARQQLESRARSQGAATAAAQGLYLWQVEYPPEFGLPADSAMIAATAGGDGSSAAI